MVRRRKILPALLVVVVVGACSQSDELSESVGTQKSALFSNGGFETGDFTSWTKTTELNNTGLASVPPTSVAQLQLSSGGTDFTFTRTNATPESQLPPGLAAGTGVPKWPKFGTTSTVINEYGTNIPAGKTYHQGANNNVNSIKQTLVTTYQDVDPTDGKLHIRFVLAPELEAAGHVPAQQPYFFVVVRNMTAPRNGEIYTNFNFANQSGVPWSSQGVGAAALLYTDWQIFDIIPDDDKFVVGDTLEVEVYASGCQPGGHSGSVYVDGFGEKFPGLVISKTAPQSTNIDEDITYKFTVENNTSGVAPNVTADEVLPPNTTFVSINAPGASCTTPAVGSTGTVTCVYGWMNPGASAQFTVVVHNNTPIDQGTATGANAGRLDDTTKNWTANAFLGWTVYITAGQGMGQQRVINSNTNTRLTVISNWTTTPNTTSVYKIVNPPDVLSTANAAGTTTTLTDTTQNWTSNQWLGKTVSILSGTGAGQQRTITSNTNNQITVTPTWTAPASGSVYAIGAPLSSIVNGNYGVKGPTISRLLGAKRETKLTAGVVYTDLSIAMADGVPSVTWGAPLTYTITVTNNGPSVANGAAVVDTFPANLTGVTWTCAGSSGGVCGAASGSGNLNSTANLPVGASVTYTVNATVVAGSGNGSIVNTATVTPPASVTEQFPANNSVTDQDSINGTLWVLTANKNPAGSGQGSITSSPAAISCGTGCTGQTASFADGTLVTLTAVAVPNNLFLGWSGACSGTQSSCTVTMNAAQTVTATFTTCGNSTLETGEGCDDGNANNGDGCNSSCKIETGLACNANASGATGSASCASGLCDVSGGAPGTCEALNTCGNSVLEAGEGCDDGNNTAGDGCNASCKIETAQPCNANTNGVTGSASCASGICDSTSGAPGVCEAANTCGNSVLEAGEGCDDGNTTAGDGCNASCKIETTRPCNANGNGATGSASCASGVCDSTSGAPGVCEAANSCGNSVREGTEGCDDGNNTNGDGCSSLCLIENGGACGPGGSASCASGVCDVTSGAPGVCEPANTCGNSVREGTEGCDDGNTANGDGCSSTCKIETGNPCGPGGSSSCQSGICDVTSGAPGVCEAANVCGNSVREGTEGCDDGNTTNGDGCDSSCKIETGNPCGPGGSSSCQSGICDLTSGAPGVCEAANVCGNSVREGTEGCDDGNTTNGDGCNSSCAIENGNPCGPGGSSSCQSGICDVTGGAPGTCEPANTCGNSVREGTEGCDDGNTVNGDGCNSACAIENGNPCGPGGSSSCQSGICDVTGGAPGTCEPANTCGNSVREGTEGCDDGNTVNGDGCNSSCKIETGNPCGPGGNSSCQSGVCDQTGGVPGVCEPANVCGNSVLDSGEGCDDGNTTNGDGCNSTCKVETGNPCGPGGSSSCQSGVCDVSGGAPGVCEPANVCGNSVLDTGEGCDDGNTTNGDGCNSSCRIETGSPCGPGGNNSCQSGICDVTGGAPGVCEAANVCGNSVVEAGEGCDDGNVSSGDGCNSSCKIETGNPCGPGGSSSCQSGICDISGGAPGVCEAANVCGNSVIEGTEGCDDGNTTAGDGCNASCKVETGNPCGPGGSSSCSSGICDVTSGAPGVCEAANVCGNSVREGTEGCDDGNVSSGDGCDASCKIENGNPCGAGGNTSCQSGICDTTSGAPGTCEPANACGNSVLEAGEGCDDGNTTAGDGCNASCKVETGNPCGPGGSTSCATGVCDVTSGAPGVCEPANVCGNSVLDSGEGCDDGNTTAGDGCSASCKIETGNPCGPSGNNSCQSGICDVTSGAPGVCEAANVCGNSVREGTEGCDDGNATNGDGCDSSCKIETGNPCGPGGSASCQSGICDISGGAPGVCEAANVCGNSVREGTEGCDDGNTTAGDGCDASCKIETGNPCGPGGSSSCSSGICDVSSGAPGVCEAANVCGNSVREGTEGCDDGNLANGDGCDSSCKIENGNPCGAGGNSSCQSGICDTTSGAPGTCEPANACGNSVLEAGEGCDDGNTTPGDGCNATCKIETGNPCGPGGNSSCQSGVCNTAGGNPGVCAPPTGCGNSVLEASEGCDDGNVSSGDGCSSSCQVENGSPCGPSGSSSCQSGICDVTSGAPGVCEAANVCGNSVREGTEGCDDGNVTAGDGCDASCKVETGNPCGPGGSTSCQSGVCDVTSGAPGVCEPANVCGNSVREGTEGCDDGNTTNGDGCNASCKIETGNPCGPGGSSSCSSGICDVTSGAPGVCEAANVCGNSVREGTEGCDDGNVTAGDGCSATCLIENGNPCGAAGGSSCSSGICDVTSGAPGTCEAQNVCGNSVLEAGEGCDDGNTTAGDGCNASCKIESGNPCGPGGGSSCQSGICDVSGGAPGTCENANVCGNSVLEAGEGCDDGNTTAGDGCNASCKIESGNPCGPGGGSSCQSGICDVSGGAPGTCENANVCGNSVLEAGEGCDDGNSSSGDGCSATCKVESGNPCGPGGSSSCESGICNVSGGAPGVCAPPNACGNSVVEAGEGCDDGNTVAGDGCNASCRIETGSPCGPGGSASCASGICDVTSGAPGVCEAANVCGNSVREGTEGCDDGNVTAGDGCDASCKVETGNPCGPGGSSSCQSGVCDVTSGAPGVCEAAGVCGNSVREGTEGCDDGNTASGDGCDASCKIENGGPCGPGGNSSCQSGVCDVTSGAPGVCEPAGACGNSVLEAGEGCDDGNTAAGDGCNASCKIENGGACSTNPSGNTGSGSCESNVCDLSVGAPGVCEPANACGNSVVEGTEGCDDGNTTAGDGCNASCKVENGGPCGPGGSSSCQSGVCDVSSGAPGVCEPANACGNSVLEAGEGCDDGNTTAGDGCDASCKIENGGPCGPGGSTSCASGVCDVTSGAPGVCEAANVCGNSVREGTEGCDDGNTTAGDGCDASCKIETGNPCGPGGSTSCASGVCDVTSGAPGVCEAANVCGNSVREGTEGCDDGNTAAGDGCDASCKIENGGPCGPGGNSSCESGVCDVTSGAPGVCEPAGACGNSVLEAGEGCDDGNTTAGDGCNSACKIEDGGACSTNPAGNTGNGSCESNVCDLSVGAPGVCEPANTCGNSVLEAGEGCDDGNTTAGDGCNASCKVENGGPCGPGGSTSCQSGICDVSGGAPGVCEPANSCGNSVLEAGEGCDDGNTTAGDGCNATCKIENGSPCGPSGSTSCQSGVCDVSGGAPGVCEPANACGNSVLEAGEGCDDGNTVAGDGCNATCKIETGSPCGPGGSSSCESGVCDVSGGAPGVCEAAGACGNSVLEAGEGCDDGNTVAGDGCNATCKIETGSPCGPGGSTSCESGICDVSGGAPGVCEAVGACGNSVLEAGEGCDDGNSVAGDGCNATCKIEDGAACNTNPVGSTGNGSCESNVCDLSGGAPGVCEPAGACGNSVLDTGEGCDDGNATAGDGCNASCKVESGNPCGPGGNSSCESGICDVSGGAPGVCENANSCGNSVLEAGEGCDDGNTTAGDNCNGSCKIESGNACNTVSPGATGNASCASNVCDMTSGGAGTCEPDHSCGNAVLEEGEGCDDGNATDGDGCNSSCRIESGNNCNVDPAGVTGNASCASNVCDVTGGAPGICENAGSCGNGVLDSNEGCDDGNTEAGDGCNASCKIEPGGDCNANASGTTGDDSCSSGKCDESKGANGTCEALLSCDACGGPGQEPCPAECGAGIVVSGGGCGCSGSGAETTAGSALMFGLVLMAIARRQRRAGAASS